MLEPVNEDIYENDELKHFGIIGMKWGIRRFQNPDGTLTPEGRARYLKNDGNGHRTLTEEGYEAFFNKEKYFSPEKKAKRAAAPALITAGMTTAGAVAGHFLAPGGAGGGAAAGAALSTLINAGLLAYNTNPQNAKGLTKEGGKFFYDENTGQLTDEAKEIIFSDTTFLTDLGWRWISEQYDKNVHDDVPSSPEYKVARLNADRVQKIRQYVAEKILPICGDMPASVYLESDLQSDNPSKETKACIKYVEELNKKYYKVLMNELGKDEPLPDTIYYIDMSKKDKAKSDSGKRNQNIQRVKSLKNSGKSLEEISEITGIPLGTVKGYLY